MAQISIDYIGHSGFLVETETSLMLFDYYRGDLSVLDAKPADKPLFVFASHAHGDHYNPVILKLAEKGREVHYLFSFDIRSRVRKRAAQDLGIRFLDADRSYEIPGLGTVETFLSTDEGVAFYIDTGTAAIFHAGDLNWWDWEGEPADWLADQERVFKREIGKLSGKRIDAAFLVLDDRLEENYDKGMSWFLSVCTPAYTLPMHFWEDRTVVKRYLAQRPQTETAILDTTCETHWDLDI